VSGVALLELLLVGTTTLGCGATIDQWRVQLREDDRWAAEENARDWLQRGDWDRALASLERAQAALSLSPRFAIESTRQKARALEELGRHEESLAHLRYLHDHHPEALVEDELPPETIHADFDDGSVRPLPRIDVPEPRYSRYASWAGVGGEVRVLFALDVDGHPKDIRVLGPAHPLLASLAIEAVAGARLRHRKDRAVLPLHWTVRFQFDAQQVPAAVGSVSGAGRGS
jgi:tetratricopeptide (TPR) repeat protein